MGLREVRATERLEPEGPDTSVSMLWAFVRGECMDPWKAGGGSRLEEDPGVFICVFEPLEVVCDISTSGNELPTRPLWVESLRLMEEWEIDDGEVEPAR